ncbi:hypothetical protein [Microbacterium oxydans]|uniref:hypothetical protein n=1 Tax=Microbacterium oxydans TaxID=82380 RepID=UPI000F8F9333|nr:hypothetical protein [Microbacterium oxydans]AZS46672.1 hypothetical protein CVS53_01346 [Microbacterium oxydans]
MQFLDSFIRQRAERITDPYNPDAEVDDWEEPYELPLEGYFETQSSSEQIDAGREQVITLRTLVLADPDADVRRGDRIVQGDKVWTVQGFPDAPRNPFTNWRPGLWVRLIEGVG